VLICWTNGKEFSSSIFYVIFKVLLSIIGVICTSVFALCIYESIAHKTPALLIVAGVFLIAFCIIKLVIELLLCGKD
ncbi:MAG: hypothetical protein IJZ20_06540, partial [Clostridia bacterium]|nr:hypothetical protein [Clostridia bacterium]